MFTVALYTTAKIWKKPNCPSTDEWIKKMWCVALCVCVCVCPHIHTYTMKYYSAIKKNEILPLATTQMDLEDITLNEVSQAEKDKCCMLSLICGI